MLKDGTLKSALNLMERVDELGIPPSGEEFGRFDSRLLNIDVGLILHRNGVNVRHLALVRQAFWRRLSSAVVVKPYINFLETEDDLTSEIRRGDQVRVTPSSLGSVSTLGDYA